MSTWERRPITILIADDHPLTRQGIRMALSGQNDLAVIAEAMDGEDALRSVALRRPDVLILDLDMPKRDGFSVVRELNGLRSTVNIIILTLHTGIDLILEALDLGIRGYVNKSSAVTEVAQAARRVAGGGNYLSKEVQGVLQKSKKRADLQGQLQRLSPMEIKLVRRIAEGFTSREIAASLDLSGRTIENYRTAICTKLNLAGPNALLRYALSQRTRLMFDIQRSSLAESLPLNQRSSVRSDRAIK